MMADMGFEDAVDLQSAVHEWKKEAKIQESKMQRIDAMEVSKNGMALVYSNLWYALYT